jgi:L-lactate dehydrogenase (cytochrome)
VSAARYFSVADARERARRTVPRAMFDYIDGAADDEVTAGRNREAFAAVTFAPAAGAGVREPDLSTSVLGAELAMPVLLAPCGLVRLMHPDGAAGAARAAHRRGIVPVVSAVAGTPLEEVAAAAPGPLWFQLYSPGGAGETQDMVQRAAAAGYGALVVTMDTAALGNRERDLRNGISLPLRPRPRTLLRLGTQVAVRPKWVAGMARSFGSAALARKRAARDDAAAGAAPDAGESDGGPTADRVAMNASPFTWDDIAQIRGWWEGPLLVKGLVTAGDAKAAVGAGADGVIVSNHGGRQLDGAPATLDALPGVVEAVGPDVPVLLDSGVRRGTDVVKAVALGASAVLIGRAYLYGLAADGEAGVARVLGILKADMVRTLVLLGCPSVRELDRTWVGAPR